MADPDLQISGRGAVIQILGAGPTGPLPWISQCLWDRLSLATYYGPSKKAHLLTFTFLSLSAA